jgi:hypothetical protein
MTQTPVTGTSMADAPRRDDDARMHEDQWRKAQLTLAPSRSRSSPVPEPRSRAPRSGAGVAWRLDDLRRLPMAPIGGLVAET